MSIGKFPDDGNETKEHSLSYFNKIKILGTIGAKQLYGMSNQSVHGELAGKKTDPLPPSICTQQAKENFAWIAHFQTV